MAIEGRLCRPHQVILQRVGPSGKGQGYAESAVFDVNIMNQAQFHDGFVVLGRMLHLLQPLHYFVFVHFRDFTLQKYE